MPKPPSNVIENEINPEWRNRMRKHRFETSRLLVHRQMKKGSWAIPGNQIIKEEKKEKVYTSYKHKNEYLLDPLTKQRLVVEKMMANPNQVIKIRTQHHAERETKIYTPHVFRNEGGNLMSSIAGAGCNKFHEFRQIRRNDMDREKHFKWLREKEKTEKEYAEQQAANKVAQETRQTRKRKKLAKKKAGEKRRREAAKERKKIRQEKIANGEPVSDEDEDTSEVDEESDEKQVDDEQVVNNEGEENENKSLESETVPTEKGNAEIENIECEEKIKKKVMLKPFVPT